MINLKKINILLNKLIKNFNVNIGEVGGRYKVIFILNPRNVIFFDPISDVEMMVFHSDPKKSLNKLLKMVGFQLEGDVDFEYIYEGGSLTEVDYSSTIKSAFGRAHPLFLGYDLKVIENPNEYNESYYYQFILTLYRKKITDLYPSQYDAPHMFVEDFRMIETKLDMYHIMDIRHVHKLG